MESGFVLRHSQNHGSDHHRFELAFENGRQVVAYSDAQASAVIAILRLIGHVDPDGSTKPRDEILGILVIGERCIARHAQDIILVIGKKWGQSIGAWLRNMAAGVIGFVRIVEQSEAAIATVCFAFLPIVTLKLAVTEG
jgi:hypothetical protein